MANAIDPVILLRPCERHFTKFFSARRSWQVVLDFSYVTKKIKKFNLTANMTFPKAVRS